GAANLGEYRAPSVGSAVLDVVTSFEVVKQVELKMIHKRGINLVSILVVGRGRRTYLVLRPIQYHSRRSYDAAPGAGRKQIRVGRGLHSHLVVQRTSHELAD